jgi:arsenate reductase
LLDANKVRYRYREYTEEPLSKSEITNVLSLLGMRAADLVRKNDAAYKDNGLTGNESETKLIALMAKHPTLLQRPIGIKGKKAILGRPPEALLKL